MTTSDLTNRTPLTLGIVTKLLVAGRGVAHERDASAFMELADVYTIAAAAVPQLPVRFGYAACDLLGSRLGPRLPAYRNILANLRVVMPRATAANRAATARRVLTGICKNYFDLFRFHTLPPAQLAHTTIGEGLEHMHRALSHGRGMLLVAPHCGNYSIGFAPLIRQFETRLLLIVEQVRDPRIHRLTNQVRQMPGIDVEALSPTIGRTILRALHQNCIVVLGGDRALAENVVNVRFFGRPTPIPSGPATLALRTGAPLLTCFVQRLPDNRTFVRVNPQLRIVRSGSLQQDICDVTQKIAYIMQAYIRRDPGQWLVAERVWPNA